MFLKDKKSGTEKLVGHSTLVNILIKKNKITKKQANKAFIKQKSSDIKLKIGEILVRMGFCTMTDIDNALKEQSEIRKKLPVNGYHERNISIVKERVKSLDNLLKELNLVVAEVNNLKSGGD